MGTRWSTDGLPGFGHFRDMSMAAESNGSTSHSNGAYSAVAHSPEQIQQIWDRDRQAARFSVHSRPDLPLLFFGLATNRGIEYQFGQGEPLLQPADLVLGEWLLPGAVRFHG